MSTWQEAQDDQGRVYFYNVVTHETSWEKPAESLPLGVWKAYKTEDGREYYHNEATGETTWDKPEGFEEKKEEDVNRDEELVDTEPNQETLSERDIELAKEEVDTGDLEKYSGVSEEEAHKLFNDMLELAKVDSTWSFEKVIQTFVRNPAYWAVSDPLKRKQLYDEYLVNKLKLESLNKTQAIERARSNFILVLDSYKKDGKLHRYTRWKSLKNTLIEEDNPIFKLSVLKDSQLKKIFTEYVDNLVKDKELKLQQKKNEALTELETYLKQVILNQDIKTLTWEKLYDQLLNDSRFKANKHFAILKKHDILELYMSEVYPKVKESIKEQLVKAQKVNYRADRKAREAFKQLLITKLKINAGSLFEDLLPQFEDEDAFIEICGRNGSTPLELFWDIVDEKSQVLKVKKDLIEAALHDYRAANLDTFDYEKVLSSLASFVETLTQLQDDRLKAFDLGDTSDEGEILVIYKQLVREQSLQMQRARAKIEGSINQNAHDLAVWLDQNLDKISLILITDDEKSEITDKTVILKKDSTYTVKSHPDQLESWMETLQEAPIFNKISKTSSKVYKDTPEERNFILKKLLKESVHSLAALLNEKLSKKRPATEYETSEAKKARAEPENRRPVFINY
uniref:Uncharacterized protein n=1 Tax=Candidozyma auris TaxID=498019 RepID=A0A0L0P389_CANAR